MGFISFLKSLFSKKVESNNEKPVVNKVESQITDSFTSKPVAVTKPVIVEKVVEEKATAKEIKASVKKVETTNEPSTSKPKRKYKPRKKKVENNTEVKPVVNGEEKPKARKPRRRPAKKKTEE